MKISDVTGTACETCNHFEVCKFSEEFISAQRAVNQASIPVIIEDSDKLRSGVKPISCIDYIEPIKLKCKHRTQAYSTNVRDFDHNNS